MNSIEKAKSISIWIFIIPFVAVNTCLLLITQFHSIFPNQEDVSIVIFDVAGRKIRSLISQNQSAGYHRIQWDAKNDLGEPVSAGMYIYILHAGDHKSVKKMVLLK